MGFKICDCGKQTKLVEEGTKMIYLCPVCFSRYDIERENTLLYNNHKNTSGTYDNIIRNSAFDPTNIRQKYDCPKCPRKIAAFIQIGENAKPYVSCKCGSIVEIKM